MIRINLLPEPRTKGVKKQWDVRIEAAGAVVVIALVVIVCLWWARELDAKIQARQSTKQEMERTITSLQAKIKEVEDFEKKKQELEDKARIIDELQKKRGGPVRTLDYISQSLEPLKLWIVKLEVKDKTVDVDGKALTQDDIVEFVNNLRRTEHFGDIRLLESRATAEGKTTTYVFKVSASLKKS